MKILVSDPLSEAGLNPLREAESVEVDIQTELTPEQLLDVIGDYEALIVRSSTQVTREVVESGQHLRVIARAGVGVDNIDVEAATQAGIIVVNAPTGNTVAAAEHTIAMLMAMARNIPQADAHVREGEWKRSRFTGIEVCDKVLGSVGLGRVAQEVARRAQGLGMKVLAHDPYVTDEYAAQRGISLVSLEEVLAQADFLTVHIPMTEQNRHYIGHEQIARMKRSARILNVARGGVLDEEALLEAIAEGRLAGAALDVFEIEPLSDESPLRLHPQIILTPHLGASTVEAQNQVAEDVAIQVLDILNDKPARYAVNAPMMPPQDRDVLLPYIDLAERLGRFISQLGAEGVSHFEVTAHGALADCDLAYVKAAAFKGLLADVVQERINLVNAALIAERRGMSLSERKQKQHDLRYETMLTIRATARAHVSDHSQPGERRWTVRGAILHDHPHVVGIDDIWVDFPAKGHLLVSFHEDRPGIIGRVGTILGQWDVNISFMHVGRYSPRSSAMMILGTDEEVSSDLINEISTFDNIHWLTTVTL
ncbi:phosphoglycerate dehydrogenase [Chloroflexi bacterium TSY]|nr:phosphoglycerate dehydrogenase [Chloroflexi bacterium TSY]